MDKTIVRLSSLKLNNIKNVENGTIVMPNSFRKILNSNGSEILGIYGQNGSGKTAVVDAVYFLQQVMIGLPISKELPNYIITNADLANIQASFNIFHKSIVYEVTYDLCLKKINQNVVIEKETLSCAKNENGKRTKKMPFMSYEIGDSEFVFTPKKRLNELIANDKSIVLDLIIAKKLAEKTNISYIFGENSRAIFREKGNEAFQEYASIIEAMRFYAMRDLFVIRNSHSAIISANLALPMAFRIEDETSGMKGDFFVPLTEPILLNKSQKDILATIVDQINIVLCTIIPDMKVSIKDYGSQLLDSGEDGWKVELMSHREGRIDIPIRMESDGIIKIISILNALIQAFGNSSICLVIDELDAGIFEYMLGELLDVFKKNAKGQLIFTSHNLRALEMLDSDNIMFSTANPKNRYIHMKNVRDTNNLRNMYIRSITLGGQDELIYEETDSLKIARAFRKAGKSACNA